MKTLKIVLIFVFAFIIPCMMFAQIGMKLSLSNKNYIKYERIYARLMLLNQSGHPIVFGTNPKLKGDVRFYIETLSGERPILLDKKYDITGKVINAGEEETFMIPITKMYRFSGAGRYRIKAILSHSILNADYQSNSVEFDIVKGHVVWKTTVGVVSDNDSDSSDMINKREYSILRYFDGKDKIYCLLVEDNNYVYGLAKLGFDIGVLRPECIVDRFSKLHILIQSSVKIYSYFVYDIDCNLEKKIVYRRFQESVPMLIHDKKTGKIKVIGGIEADEGVDYQEDGGI